MKVALETDELLDECLNRCNLERHLGKQVCMLGGLWSRQRADEIEEKADGRLGSAVWEQHGRGQKKRSVRADEGAAGVAKFFSTSVDHKWKLSLFKALVQGALTSAGERNDVTRSST